MGWEEVIYFIVSVLISIALAPKPKAPRQAAIDDFKIPTAQEGRPIPVIFGEVICTGPNCVWYGDLSIQSLKKRAGFSTATVGYKYSLGLHMVFCHGPVDEAKWLTFDGKLQTLSNHEPLELLTEPGNHGIRILRPNTDPFQASVEVALDLYPGQIFKGKVQSIWRGSGEGQYLPSGDLPKFAPLPPNTPQGCFAVQIVHGQNHASGAIVLPMVEGYPEDQIEIVASDNLRAYFALDDGDLVTLQILS